MNTLIDKNLKEALTQVRGRYCDGCDVCLEIPAFFIIPGTENYKAFGLDLLHDQLESKLEFVHIVRPKEIKENHIRLRRGERTEEFDLTDDDFENNPFSVPLMSRGANTHSVDLTRLAEWGLSIVYYSKSNTIYVFSGICNIVSNAVPR